ncbi:acetylcholine receptor subunit beta-like 1 [Centruroides sculpturatus]|uniref:acetylcholine receptor subunit beta-like 1 n=1 Tax=Centruroides sculpturatus TaxID=218467 RepID=UPI000C6D198B|nr:acetylcholine receptor subunit beta-like 1 [Centruroides sculpturatus]
MRTAGFSAVWLLTTALVFPANCSEDEERLVRDLFRDYNKLIRPVEVMKETVEVQFGLSFIQLINVVSPPLPVASCAPEAEDLSTSFRRRK